MTCLPGKPKHHIIIVLFVLSIFVLILPLCASASTIASGICGDLNWTLSDDNILTIAGEGMLPNDTNPWNDYSLGDDYNNKIVSVVIEEGVTRIGSSAFSFMSNLKTISLPNSLLSIGNNNFYSCAKLTDITLPNNLQTIEYSCFSHCPSITTVHIPASVSNIGFFCFEGNTSQVSFTVDESSESYCTVDGVLFTKDMSRLHQRHGTLSLLKSSLTIYDTYYRKLSFSRKDH